MTASKLWIRSLRLAALAPAALVLSACAGAPQQTGTGAAPAPSAPSAASPAPTALPQLSETQPPPTLDTVERFAWQRTLQLGQALSAGDVTGFLGSVSHGFYRGYTTLESSLRSLIEGSSSRSVVVAVREVSTEGDRVSVRAEWTRRLTRRDGSADARQGETTFLYLKSDTSLRLLDYRGAAPFAIDGI